MKKGLALIAVVIIAVAVYFIIFNRQEKTTPVVKKMKPARLTISKNPQEFNTAFSGMLVSYYNLKDALVNWDSTKATQEAKTLSQLASQVPLSLLKADSNIVLTAKNLISAVVTESNDLSASKTILEKRRSFSILSDNLYSLINTVRYDKEVIYYDMCPMAFGEDEQAYWLSRDSAISNPYLGNKHPKYHSSMINCGNVEDMIDYASKQ